MNDEMKERVRQMANRTWGAIANDCLTANQEYGDGSSVMARPDVCELVADASHMLYHGGDEEAYREFDALEWGDREDLLLSAFPHSYYGR